MAVLQWFTRQCAATARFSLEELVRAYKGAGLSESHFEAVPLAR